MTAVAQPRPERLVQSLEDQITIIPRDRDLYESDLATPGARCLSGGKGREGRDGAAMTRQQNCYERTP